jgi:predicted PurR-regulated permease PerM
MAVQGAEDGHSISAEDGQPGEPLVIRMPVDVKSAALTLIGVLAFVLALQWAREVFIPIVVAILVSYALDPLVIALGRIGLHRAIASGLVVLMLMGALGIAAWALRDEAAAVVDSLPSAVRRVRQAFQKSRGAADPFDKVQEAAREIEQTAQEAAPKPPVPRGVTRVQIQEPAIRVGDYLWWGSMGVAAVAAQATVVVFLVYFLLASGDLYKRKLVRIAGPSMTEKRLTVQILREIDSQIEKFLMVQVAMSFMVAVVTTILLYLLGVEYAVIWGLAAGILNSIPYIGPIIVTVGLALVSFLQFGTLLMALYTAGIALVITTIEGFFLTPALMGKAARMNEVAVFVGLLFWGWLWGFWGAILAVPMLMVIKTVCDRVEGLQPFGELLGEKAE